MHKKHEDKNINESEKIMKYLRWTLNLKVEEDINTNAMFQNAYAEIKTVTNIIEILH